MPKGGRRSTTWDSPWESGKTKLVRVPESIAEEVLTFAHRIDRGERITDDDGKEKGVEALYEKAD